MAHDDQAQVAQRVLVKELTDELAGQVQKMTPTAGTNVVHGGCSAKVQHHLQGAASFFQMSDEIATYPPRKEGLLKSSITCGADSVNLSAR